ncbi:MAG: Na(+)-translocating NADH-quinone reductase subunit A [Thermodesulfobacteriota bacterium]
MADITLKKGFTIRLDGAPSAECEARGIPPRAALMPTDFRGITPALLVKEGDHVRAGTPLFTDKTAGTPFFVSPLSGRIERISRGERRRVTGIVIAGDGKGAVEESPPKIARASSREDIIDILVKTGLFASLRQRPFAVQARPVDMPRDIFISSFDTSPLAPDTGTILAGNGEYLAKGLDILRRLTSGRIHFSVRRDDDATARIASGIPEVAVHRVKGPHPAGTVGVQVHHIAPVRGPGDVVWYCTLESAVRIGRLFATGMLSFDTVIAIGGPASQVRKHIRTVQGAEIGWLLGGAEVPETRYISGNVLTGRNAGFQGFIGFFDNQVSVIRETARPALFGWIRPGIRMESASNTFFSRLFPGRRFDLDTNVNGGCRPFVATGNYEKVLPMDIHPVHLVKSILAGDIEEMEGLGIYEMAEEEMAICEYICPSKSDMQRILRDGIDMIMREG